jgi:hypothetical protein
MMMALVLICSLAKSPLAMDCGTDNAVDALKLPGEYYSLVTCFARAQAFVAASRYDDGDSKADIMWRNDTGQLFITLMNGTAFKGGGSPGTLDNAFRFAGTADYDGDGRGDLLWRKNDGTLFVTEMNGTAFEAGGSPGTVIRHGT